LSNETREFKIVKTIFAIGFLSAVYLVLVFGFQRIGDGENPDTFVRVVFAGISFVVMWASYSKIEKFTEQLLDQNPNDPQRGGTTGKNSLQD